MANFLISYDLIKDKNYTKLINELQRLGATKILLSHWFVNLNNNAAQVRDHFAKFMDGDDKLFIVDCSRNTWAARYLDQNAINALQNKWAVLVS